MKIKIAFIHLKKNPKIKKYTFEKIEKLEKYYHKIEKIDVRLISEKAHRGQDNDYICELRIKIPGKVLEIIDTERAIDKAVDKAVERAKVTLTRAKEKELSKFHKASIKMKGVKRI